MQSGYAPLPDVPTGDRWGGFLIHFLDYERPPRSESVAHSVPTGWRDLHRPDWSVIGNAHLAVPPVEASRD